jgi:methionyl-tRNA formyltransferase
LRTVFLGTSSFASAVLERLAASEHRPALAMTRPDRPQGRGRRLASPPVADTARALGMELEQPDRINAPEVCERIAATGAEVVVVCAFGALIGEPLLSSFKLLNVHPSLLPRWRGAAPVERAIMAGDARTGVSIMRITEGLDSGPVCLTGEESISPEDDYGSLAKRLQELGAQLLLRALDEAPRFAEQDDAEATYAEKIGAADRLLDPAATCAVLERTVRALHPHVVARIAMPDGTSMGVHRAAVYAQGVAGAPAAGEVAVVDDRLLFGASDGAIELLCVQPAGGKAMDAGAYLRGHAVPRS